MHPSELALMRRELGSGVETYLEFGMGGSTLLAVQAGIRNIVAVDSDAKWVEEVRSSPMFASHVEQGRASLLYADIGPIERWGRPVDTTPVPKWTTYLTLPWQELDRRGLVPDLIFVDGRFRVACCFSIFLASVARLATEGGPRVLIHDFTRRTAYHSVFTHFETVEDVRSMHLLRMRRDASAIAAVSQLLTHQYDYR
jgi:hypothetical protein